MQADKVLLPVNSWGSKGRNQRGVGLYHFYTDDYRFEALYKDPGKLIYSDCQTIVEPNFSIYDTTEKAVAIYQIYRKRIFSAFLQDYGFRVFADLNVSKIYYALNLLGVPRGWKSYATRGYSDRAEDILREYEIAYQHCGNEPFFVVFGGGKRVHELCLKHKFIHIREQIEKNKGKGDYV